eukprot:4609358-Prymnesium_polylepis.1
MRRKASVSHSSAARPSDSVAGADHATSDGCGAIIVGRTRVCVLRAAGLPARAGTSAGPAR